MKFSFGKIISAAVETIKRFPVETGIIAYGFIIASLLFEDVISCHEDNAAVIPLFFFLALILNSLLNGRGKLVWIYYLCWIPMPLLWFFDLESWVFSAAYIVTCACCVIGLAASRLRKDNTEFASDTAFYIFNAVASGVFAGIAHLLLIAIYFSIQYIFNIWHSWENEFFFYSAMTAYIIAWPLMFLTFTRNNIGQSVPPTKMVDILLNFILTPALLIYTTILYIYFIKITLTWSLPEGGIAYMVFIFTMLAMIVKACQPLLTRRLYDWFFNRFSLIALPAVIMFWVGVLYRVNEYGFTELRVYLVLCGAIMTLFLAMFLSPKTGKYLYAAGMIILLLGIFTYIPPISAKKIAIRSQTKLVSSLVNKIGLLNESGEFLLDERPVSDTAYRQEYQDMYESLRYLERNDAPLLGLKSAREVYSILPEEIRDQVEYTLSTDASDHKYIYSGNIDLDISGYNKLHSISSYQSDDVIYRYEFYEDSIHIFHVDSLIWQTTERELLDKQLAVIGYTRENLPSLDSIESRRDQFLVMRNDTLALVFNNMSLKRDEKGIHIPSFDIATLLLNEPKKKD